MPRHRLAIDSDGNDQVVAESAEDVRNKGTRIGERFELVDRLSICVCGLWRLTFITSSLVIGVLVFVPVLWLLWHPIPFIGLPRGSFDEHVPLTIKLGVHALLPQWFAHDAQWYATFWSQLSVPVSSFGLFRE